MTPVTLEVQKHVVRDDNRDLHFIGAQIGAASTQEPGKSRWTEMTLYRTEAGNYVLATVGRSTRRDEVDIFSARVCDSPQAVVNELLRTRDGVEFISHVARDLMDDAAPHDPELWETFRMQHVE